MKMPQHETQWASEVQMDVGELTRDEYGLICRLVYSKSGINLGDQKMQLVRARLGKRLRERRIPSFRDYCRMVQQDVTGEELCHLLDAISTNTTHLFREIRHFEFLRRLAAQWAVGRARPVMARDIRIWSAGCSSGEEPYSIGMTLHDALGSTPRIDWRILATDLSVQMLSRAKLGLFETNRVGTVPAELRSRYFSRVQVDGYPWLQVVPELRKLITFARFNLMSPTFPFRHGFDVIFCRNVMIYFDRLTQETLVGKFAAHLRTGGYLLIGHSESLNGLCHPLAYVEPTIYRKD